MPTAVTLDNTIGALELGSVLAVFLFGVVTLQTHLYYQHFRDDRLLFKGLVAVIWFLELGHTIGVLYETYRTTVTLYGEVEKLTKFQAISGVIVVGGAITWLVQGFFSIRLLKVLPHRFNYIGIFCLAVASIRFIGSAVLTYAAVAAVNILIFTIQWDWLITSLLVVGAAIDVIIAASMLYFLYKRRANALDRSITLIDRLLAWTIRTGLITSITAVSLVICFKLMPNNFIWLALYTFLAKLYSNALLSSLNERRKLRSAITNAPSTERYSKRPRVGEERNNWANHAISIEMKTTTELIGEDSVDNLSRRPPAQTDRPFLPEKASA